LNPQGLAALRERRYSKLRHYHREAVVRGEWKLAVAAATMGLETVSSGRHD
jgi:hypothetical protein